MDEIDKEIEDNLEDIMREREEYMKADGQSSANVSKLAGQPNTYVLEGETRERMEEIDRKLREHNPAAQNNMSLVPTSESPFILPGEESARKNKKGMMDS